MPGGCVEGLDVGVGGQTAGGAGLRLNDGCALGQVKVEGVAANLGARGDGGVLHAEGLDEVERLAGGVGLGAQD